MTRVQQRVRAFLSAAGIVVAGCRAPAPPVAGVTPARPATGSSSAGSAATATAAPRGPSRADIKNGGDPDAATVQLTPRPLSVEALTTMPLPAGFTGNLEDSPNRRVGEFERQIWSVEATLRSIQLRSDGDYYIEFTDSDGRQGVMEVPDPAASHDSPLHPLIAAARHTLEARYHPTTVKQQLNDAAVLEGVGFYGFRGHQNGGRLAPGISVSFTGN